MPMEKYVCTKCEREKRATDFFKMRDGSRYDICKNCLTAHIDNRKPQTFEWILQEFDVPYIERQWIEIYNREYAKNPQKFGPQSVLGFYLRSMNMVQYRDYRYADSDRLNAENARKEREAEMARLGAGRGDPGYEEELKAKLDSGEITQAEYNTLSMTVAAPIQKGEAFIEDYGANESILMNDLTNEDRLYLSNKWGISYKPSEWIFMEQLYNDYDEEYEINVDRREALKQICKMSLKLNNAIDAGDMSTVKDLTRVIGDLRKSAKFTEAQNKEEAKEEEKLSTVGELVALCEQEHGIIDHFPIDPDEYPQDKIDFTIKDLKNYNYNLITNELGLGDLIQSYIEKLERAAEDDQRQFDQMITSLEEESAQELEDEDMIDYEAVLEDEIESEVTSILSSIGED